MEGRIEKQLVEDYKTENSDERNLKNQALNELEGKRSLLNEQIQFYWSEVNFWSKRMQEETVGAVVSGSTGINGQGPAYREAERNMILNQNNQAQAQKNYNDFIANEYNQKIETINSNYDNQQVTQQFDLLSKYQALAKLELNDKTNSVTKMSWGITLLFMLFEIIPSLIKLMTPQTEYDAILEARRRLNIQLTNALANEGLEELDADNLKFVFNQMDKKPLNKEKRPLYYINDIKNRLIVD